MGSVVDVVDSFARSSAVWAVLVLAIAAVPFARWLRAKRFADAAVSTVWAATISCGGIVALTLLRDGIPHGWAPGNLTHWGERRGVHALHRLRLKSAGACAAGPVTCCA